MGSATTSWRSTLEGGNRVADWNYMGSFYASCYSKQELMANRNSKGEAVCWGRNDYGQATPPR